MNEILNLKYYYRNLVKTDNNKIKEISSSKLAEDITSFFRAKTPFCKGRYINSSRDDYTCLNIDYGWLNHSHYGYFHLVTQEEWEKKFGKVEEDEELMFYDKVEELVAEIFNSMSDTQRYEILKILFKNRDQFGDPVYLCSGSYFPVCIRMVNKCSPKVAQECMCKILDEYLKGLDWSQNLSDEEKDKVNDTFCSILNYSFTPKDFAKIFHQILKNYTEEQDYLEKSLSIFKNSLSYMNKRQKYYSLPYTQCENGIYIDNRTKQYNEYVLNNNKYNKILFELFKYEDTKNLISKVSLILAEVYSSYYDIKNKSPEEIADIFKSVVMRWVEIGPRYEDRCSDIPNWSYYAVELFDFLMKENRTDALDAICEIQDIDNIFPLLKLKGFIFQNYIESKNNSKNHNIDN